MSITAIMVWIGLGLAGMVGSALFSGLETGLYTVNRISLHVLAHQARSSAAVLERMLQTPNRLLGTLLVGNNLANYLASLAIAALLGAAGYRDWMQVIINAALLTPLLFIFGEVLPKDLFRSHSDRLTLPFAKPLRFMQIALTGTGVLPLIDLVSNTIQRFLKGPELPGNVMHPRRVVTHLIREGVGHGVISAYQSEVIDRVLQLGRLRARDVMEPFAEATTVRVNQPPEAVWALADRAPYTRLPLLDTDGWPIGLINVFEVLMHEPTECPPLKDLAHPLPRIAPNSSCRSALLNLQRQRASMGLLIEGGQPLGLVTIKDLVEPIVGELDVW